MTQTVRGPDGRVHNFPDQATPQQIQGAMRQIYGMQQPQQQASNAPQPPQPSPPSPPAPPSQGWQAGTERTPFVAPNVTGNRSVDVALEPITGYRERLNQAFTQSDAWARHGAQTMAKGDMTGLAGFIPGLAGMASAPISAALEPLSRPVNEYASPILEKTFGTPPEISTPALTSLIPGMGVTKFPMPKAPPSLPKPSVKLGPAPTNQELRSQAGRQFKAAEDSGVVFKQEGVEKLRQSVLADLEDAGFDVDLHPRVAAVLKRLDQAAGENLTLRGGEIIRRVAQSAAKSADADERRIGYKIIDQITEFLTRPDDADVLIGDARSGGQALANAREIWARMSKSEAIDAAIEAAGRRASVTGSGANIDNTIRQNVNRILGKDGKPRGFTAEEVKALKEIANGTPLRNALRLVGKAAPTGVVSGGFGIATTATMPGGWMVPIAGFLAKLGADTLTKTRAEKLSESIRRGRRTGAPQAQLPSQPAPKSPPLALSYDKQDRN